MFSRPSFRHAALLALVLPLPAPAEETSLRCELSTICLGLLACQDWSQTVTIIPPEAGEDWSVDWAEERRAGYALVADIPAPADSLRPTRLRTLVHTTPDTQAVQIVSFSDLGDLTVTLHQPQVTPQAVTAFGQCAVAPAEATE